MVSSEVINACPDYSSKPRLKRLFRIVVINLTKYFRKPSFSISSASSLFNSVP
jgi:hypothetical protein